MKSLGFILVCIVLLNLGCSQKPKELERNVKHNESENLLLANKYLVKKDMEAIEGYVKRRNWNMQVSPTGLWYMIYKKGNGKKVENGNRVSLKYTVSLLDGTTCYSSDSIGNKTFVAGKGGVERGLEEGILYLRQGDKARFIMLPHLAYGLAGDQNCIPARATVLFEVELVSVAE